MVFIRILTQYLKNFYEFFLYAFSCFIDRLLYLSILINYIIPYFYTNVKSKVYKLSDTIF